MKGQVVPVEKLNFPLVGQMKFDGVRLHVFVRDNKVRFQTFNGHTVPLPALETKYQSLPNCMLDTEIVYRDGSMKYRSIVSGMINSAMKGGRINQRELNLHAFDSMPITDWDRKHCNRGYTERYEDTLKLVSSLEENSQMHFAVSDVVYSIDQANERVEDLWEAGYEGLMLKELDHRYTFTKSRLWAKFKQTKTADLLCTGVTEGTGWCEGMIGALELEGIVEGKAIKVKAGSGMTASDRSRDPNFYLGNTIEIKYNSVTRDARTGQWSLFLPRYKIVRFDK